MWFTFYLLNALVIWCNGLKIFENSFNTTEYKKFYHRTADFGPSAGHYNVSGRLEIMDPLIACGIGKYVNKTDAIANDDDDLISYKQIYKDEIVLILRGNCTFNTKVSNAELLGAIGVIVGDYNTSSNEWIVMSQTKHSRPITIPSVFVPHNTYQWIVKLLLSHSNSAAATHTINIQAAADDDGTQTQQVLLNDMDINGVYAILDEDGEYIAPTSTFWLAAFGIVIIVIPTLWCFIVCMALLRKKIINYVQRSRRRQYLTQIPVILYKGNGNGDCDCDRDETQVNVGLSVICNGNMNKKKTKQKQLASDDHDKYAQLVNIENEDKETVNENENNNNNNECTMNKTEIMAGSNSFSSNFKNMSRLLLNSFRTKKEFQSPHNDSCAICLEDFKVNEELRLLPCNHAFHKQCVDPWLDKSSELCPMCKQSIFMNNNDNNMGHDHGCFHSILKICCIANHNNNNNRQDQNNIEIVHNESEGEEDGIIVLSSAQDELVTIDSDMDDNQSQSDHNDNQQDQVDQ